MYKSIVDILPREWDYTQGANAEILVSLAGMHRTIMFSIDDVVTLFSGGMAGDMISSGSYVRVWNANHFSEDILGEFEDHGFNVVHMSALGARPYTRDVVDMLPVNKNSEWYPYNERPLEYINTITIHHSASWNTRESNYGNVYGMAAWHTGGHGWPGIGYHYVVAPNGELFVTNNITTISYHAGSIASPGDENAYSVGVCLGGDFRDGRQPTESQISVTAALVASIRNDLPLHVSVTPHKRMCGASTACPGDEPDPWLKIIDGYKLSSEQI